MGPNYSISVSYWMKADYTDVSGDYPFSINDNSNAGELHQRFGSSGHIEVVSSGTSTIFSEYSASPEFTGGNNNTWKHVVITWNTNSSEVKFYLNGSLKTTGSLTLDDQAITKLDIGRRISSPYFTGSLDDFRIYNRILTPSEVTVLYNE